VTLADRMAESPLSVPDAVRISMLLAEVLRGIHEQGRVHGAVCPRNLALAESSVTLLDGDADLNYTAPEGAVDARSDIFSFGAMVFEMFLGRRPNGAESTGSPAVDRVLLPCLAADPQRRPARMQKVLLELRWLKMAARRAAAVSSAKRREARLAARLDAQERAVAEMQRSAGEAVVLLRAQVAAARERAGTPRPDSADAATPLTARVDAVEQSVETMKKHTDEFEHSVAADLVDIEESMRRQATAMEAIRNQLTQTDVVVERMVKALESLQRAVLDRDESGNSTIVVN